MAQTGRKNCQEGGRAACVERVAAFCPRMEGRARGAGKRQEAGGRAVRAALPPGGYFFDQNAGSDAFVSGET